MGNGIPCVGGLIPLALMIGCGGTLEESPASPTDGGAADVVDEGFPSDASAHDSLTAPDADSAPDTDSAPDAASAPDAISPPDAAGDAGKGGAVAVITWEFTMNGQEMSMYSSDARFWNDHAEGASGCTSHVDGPCRISECPTDDTSGGPYPHAGEILISGGAVPVTLVPGADGVYQSEDGYSVLWSGGELLGFQAGGGEVPAFFAQMQAPEAAILTSPAPAASPTLLDTTQDLEIGWSGGSNHELVVVLGSGKGVHPEVTAWCEFPVPDGFGSVPASALQKFPKGSVELVSYVVASSDIVAGEFAVRLLAYAGATTPDGSLAAFGFEIP